MNLTSVIRRPIVTEKTTRLREESNTLVFDVAIGATKVDIRQAVEHLRGEKIPEFLEGA